MLAAYHYLSEIFFSVVGFLQLCSVTMQKGSGSGRKEGLVFPFHRMRGGKISPRLQIMSVVDLRTEDLPQKLPS